MKKDRRGALVELKTIKGRMHVLQKAIRPDQRDPTVATDQYVDVEPLRGSTLWMSRAAAKQIVGVHGDWMNNAAKRGILQSEEIDRNHVWFRMDPDWTLKRLVELFRADPWTPQTYADFELYNARRTLLRIPSEEPYPDHVLDAAVEFLVDLGAFNLMEARGLLIVPDDAGHMYADLRRRKTGIWRRLARFKDEIPIEDFRELLPDAAGAIPGTCWDQTEADERPSPPARILGRLAKLDALMIPASIYVLLMAGRGMRVSFIEDMTRSFEALDRLVGEAGIDIYDAAAVSAFLEALALQDTIGGDISAGRREALALAWLSLARQIAAVAVVTPPEHAPVIAAAAPADHTHQNSFRSALKDRNGAGREYSQVRKARVKEVAERVDFLIAATRRRCDQLADVADDAHAEREALLASGRHRQKLETESWPLGPDAIYGDGGPQTIHGWLWKGEALWEHLYKLDDPELRPLRRRMDAAREKGVTLGAGRFYYQYERIADADGNPGPEPWFATIFKAGVTISPSSLEVEHRQFRADIIKQWRLPGFQPSSAGLLSFGRDDSFLYRCARRHGIDLIALDQFDILMRASHLAFRAGLMTGCRLFESIQMAHRKGAWPVITIGPKISRTGWMAVPGKSREEREIGEKLTKKRFFPVDDLAFRYFNELADVVIRSGDRGSIPDVNPAKNIADTCQPDRYVMSCDGTAMQPADLLLGLRYLLAGIQICTYHDARHSSANRGWQEGEEISATMLRLGHSVERHAIYYRSLPDDPRNEASDRFLNRREAAENMRYWEHLCAKAN